MLTLSKLDVQKPNLIRNKLFSYLKIFDLKKYTER